MATTAQIIAAQRQPLAIRNAWNLIAVNCEDEVYLGIIGDSNHGSGYHMSYNYCWYVGDFKYGQDYSCQYQRDKNGDPDACRAIDIGWGGANETHWRVTKHVIARLAAGDPRLRGVRQVLGSDGPGSTIGYDSATGKYNKPDSSHLGHLHTSFWGDSVDDQAAMNGFAEVVIEGANGSASIGDGLNQEEDMDANQARMLTAVYDAIFNGGPSTPQGRSLLAITSNTETALLFGGTDVPVPMATMLETVHTQVENIYKGLYFGGESTPGGKPLTDVLAEILAKPTSAGSDPKAIADYLAAELGADLASKVAAQLTVAVKK